MEMIELSYDYTNKVLVVALEDGSSKTYLDKETYLADWPDREADCVAIGWTEKKTV